MELELNRTKMTGYDTMLDTTVFQEETLETIVPDASPDILRLIDTQGSVILKSKAASDGRALLTGTARMTVLYVPDGGTGPCHLEVSIPFSIAVEGKNLKSGCVLTALPRISNADTRTINPRKIVTRVEVAIWVRAFQVGSTSLCVGANAEGGTVELRKETHRPYRISAVIEKQIELEDDLNIPAGRPAAEELLKNRVELCCHESKVIGNKLIIKGEAVIQLVYRPTSEGMDAADFTMPFSGIAEVTGVSEDGLCSAEVCLANSDFTLGGDGRTVSVSLSVAAQAVIWEAREIAVLNDLYSTCCEVKAERTAYHYNVRQMEDSSRQIVREVVESGFQIKSVIDAYCSIGQQGQSSHGGQLRLTTDLNVTAICMTEDGDYCAVSRHVETGCDIEAPEGCSCQFSCRCGTVIATPTASGVEVHFTVDFPFVFLRDVDATVISNVNIETQQDQSSEVRPSVVLRVINEGECLWDVAKRYRTTIQDIMQVNELEDEQPSQGTLLLIPRKR